MYLYDKLKSNLKTPWEKSFWRYLFSTYAKFPEKLKFITPDMHTYVCVSGIKKF